MSIFATIGRTVKTVQKITKLITNVTLSSKSTNIDVSKYIYPRLYLNEVTRGIHMSARQNGLMEFFDIEKNWSQKTIKVGRSWRTDELRLKSNEDLHKLWYILLKEKNMLLTMEHACKTDYEYFPNPERIDKVAESMENIETVVRERNRAYHELEIGEHGERPTRYVKSRIGLPFRYRSTEHLVPQYMNTSWQRNNKHGGGGNAVQVFLRKYREKLFLRNRRARNREQNRATSILRRFPNVDVEAVKAKYPNANIEKIKTYRRRDGHFIPK